MPALLVPVKAHVRNGYFVTDEPANLPEGTPVELQLVTTDPWADRDPEERAELEEAIEAGYGDIENGDVVNARKFLAELRARTRQSQTLEAGGERSKSRSATCASRSMSAKVA